MMGVGIRPVKDAYGNDTSSDYRNPFLNLDLSGTPSRSFIVTTTGVTFNYSASEKDTFDTTSYRGNTGNCPLATVTLVPPVGSPLAAYTQASPFLVDTGLDYMIVTPIQNSVVPWSGYVMGDGHWVPGVTVIVALGVNSNTIQWDFSTNDFGASGVPDYARFAVPSPNGIINSGQRILDQFDYLIDTSSGVVGLRSKAPAPSTPSSASANISPPSFLYSYIFLENNY
jgi:hypothetical protein